MLDLVGEDLDLAADQVGIDRALGARPHASGGRDDEFVAELFGDRERGRAVGIADDLHQAFAIAQVDENDAAVVAAAMNPSADRHGFAQSLAVDTAAIIGALQAVLQRRVIAGAGRSGGEIPRAGGVIPEATRRRCANTRPPATAGRQWAM